jgi:transposase
VSKRFRTCDLDQEFLLPPSLQDWLPENHLARFVADVTNALDLSKIVAVYGRKDGRGMAAYHPVMMVRMLLYGYCRGVVSSRKIERATYEDVAFRYLAADQHPDHDSIASFRQTHLQSLAELFSQALRLCDEAGLVKLGHVAIDGTKLKANASKHKAMSYERMGEKEKQLREEVEKLLAQAEQADAAEDAKHGKGNRGDELPAELARRESRLKKIAEAKAALEQEARERATVEKAAAEAKLEERRRQEEAQGKKFGGRPPQVPDPEQAKPEPKAQRNFTDPESRIMKDGATKCFMQAYNGQAAVDSHAQIIVAAALTQDANDKKQLLPMLEQVAQNMGRKPEHATADAGYFSEAAVTDPQVEGIELLVPPERQKRGVGNETSAVSATAESPAAAESKNERVGESTGQPAAKSAAETMREKLRTTAGQAVYKMRKAVVEPVFGQIKERRGLRGFLMRGRKKVAAEWQIICLTHNLLKLFQARTAPANQAKSRKTPSKSGELAYAGQNCGFFAWICTLCCKVWRWSSSESDVAHRGLSFIPTDS